MTTFIENSGQYKTSINGKTVENANWDLVYDGNTLDLEAKHNNQQIFLQLDHDDIIQLLEIPASQQTLEEKLMGDLSYTDVQPIIIENQAPIIYEIKPSKSHKRRSRSKKSHSKKSHSKIAFQKTFQKTFQKISFQKAFQIIF